MDFGIRNFHEVLQAQPGEPVHEYEILDGTIHAVVHVHDVASPVLPVVPRVLAPSV